MPHTDGWESVWRWRPSCDDGTVRCFVSGQYLRMASALEWNGRKAIGKNVGRNCGQHYWRWYFITAEYLHRWRLLRIPIWWINNEKTRKRNPEWLSVDVGFTGRSDSFNQVFKVKKQMNSKCRDVINMFNYIISSTAPAVIEHLSTDLLCCIKKTKPILKEGNSIDALQTKISSRSNYITNINDKQNIKPFFVFIDNRYDYSATFIHSIPFCNPIPFILINTKNAWLGYK